MSTRRAQLILLATAALVAGASLSQAPAAPAVQRRRERERRTTASSRGGGLASSRRETDFMRSAIAGGVAAAAATVAFHPIDTVKTVLQGGGGRAAVGALGVRGLYRGVVPAAASMMPACAVRMGSYEVLKQLMLTRSGLPLPPSALVALSSALSVVASCTVRCPLDMIKTQVRAPSRAHPHTTVARATRRHAHATRAITPTHAIPPEATPRERRSRPARPPPRRQRCVRRGAAAVSQRSLGCTRGPGSRSLETFHSSLSICCFTSN